MESHHAVRSLLATGCLAIGLAAVGCQMLEADPSPPGASLLTYAPPSDGAVVLDFYWAELPAAVERDDELLWKFVHEDRVPAEVRAELSRHGFRAGVVGGVPPEAISRMLNPTGKAADETDDSEMGIVSTIGQETGVEQSRKQVPPNRRVEIPASKVMQEMRLADVGADLEIDAASDDIATFTAAQAIYVLRVDTLAGQTVVELTPEVKHGQPKIRLYSDDTGAIQRQAPMREAMIFSKLRTAVPLSAGEMLVITSTEADSDRLGGYFHASDHGGRRALLIRLAHAPPTDAFAANTGPIGASFH